MRDGRWRKLWRDLRSSRRRCLLVVLALALALAGAGAVLDTWALVQRATERGFLASQPVAATLSISAIDEATLARLEPPAEVAAWRLRRSAQLAVETGGRWRQALLFAMDNFTREDIGRLQAHAGAWPPPEGTVVIEKSSLAFSGASMGEPLLFKAAGQEPRSLAVAGIVRDVSLAPGWMEHLVYGYATASTLQTLGLPQGFGELQLRLRDPRADRAEVRRVAEAMASTLQALGVQVGSIDVPPPGEHVHAAQMNSLMLTQAAFGLLALLVCAFLVINLMAAMLAGQAREVGVMKVLGARPSQIAGIYLGQALLLGVAATAIALPLAAAIARPYAAFKGELLNLPVDGHAIPAWAIALQALVGLLLPVLAAAWPVQRACRQPVGEALRDVGIHAAALGRPLRPRSATWPRPVLMALANAFRKRRRTLLTMLGLAAAGAVGIGAANLRLAVQGSVDLLFAAQRYHLTVRLADAAPAAQQESVAAAVEGVAKAEAWRTVRVVPETDAGDAGRHHEAITLVGVMPEGLLQPTPLQGRWLAVGDHDVVVLSRRLAQRLGVAAPGERLSWRIEGRARRLQVLGIVDSGPQPLAYTTRAAIESWSGHVHAASLQVALRSPSAAVGLETVQALRQALNEAGMPVASTQLASESRRVLEDHLLMVVDFLGVMGLVMLAIGAIGLASTMALAVLERTREIGVMRVLGARNRDILALVQTEALVIVGLAWLLALPLSVLAGVQLGQAFGRVMFAVPVRLAPPADAALRWLAVMVLLSLLASAAAAWRAMRIPAGRALATS